MRPRVALSMLIATAATACSALVGDYQVTPEGVSTARLCDIERAAFAFPIDLASTVQQPDLETYYELANPDLATHLASISQSYAMGNSEARITYVMGTAGVGKSFALRNVLDGFTDIERCDIQLGDLFGQNAASLGLSVVPMPDLASLDGQLTFNELPGMADPSTFDSSSLFTAAGCDAATTLTPLIVVDDLDEIDEASSTAILRAIDQFVLGGATGAGPFIHFVVAGRPEGFNGWLTDPDRNEQSNAIVDRFILEAPRYQTGGDLDFRVRGYLEFTAQLADLEANGGLAGYIGSVSEAVSRNPFLSYSMGNLAVGNVAIERTRPGVDESEEQIKIGLFDDIILRASQSHGRPDAGSALGSSYLRVLEDIAVRYVDVGDDGVFEVLSEDTVDVHDDAGTVIGQVRVRDVLDRAGVALLTSAFAAGTRYRFDPFWLHAHLVERYNQRTIPGYVYHPCQ